jgi:hypothetical protein
MSTEALEVLTPLLSLSAAAFLARSPFGEVTTLAGVDREQFWTGSEECLRRYRAQVNAAVGLGVLCASVALMPFASTTWSGAGLRAWLVGVAFVGSLDAGLLGLAALLMRRKRAALKAEGVVRESARQRSLGLTPDTGA